jgi:hypothetical protein
MIFLKYRTATCMPQPRCWCSFEMLNCSEFYPHDAPTLPASALTGSPLYKIARTGQMQHTAVLAWVDGNVASVTLSLLLLTNYSSCAITWKLLASFAKMFDHVQDRWCFSNASSHRACRPVAYLERICVCCWQDYVDSSLECKPLLLTCDTDIYFFPSA